MNILFVVQNKYLQQVFPFVYYNNTKLDSVVLSLDEEIDTQVGFDVYPISQIVDYLNMKFDQAVLLCDIAEQVCSFLTDTFHDRMPEIINLDRAAVEYLTSEGKMVLLREWIEFRFPRPDIPYVSIGDFTYFDKTRFLSTIKDGSVECRIGKFCSIAGDVRVLLGAEHQTDWNSTYPFAAYVPGYHFDPHEAKSKGNVVIGNDVWIGYGVTILSGVSIGDGSVIGAGSVISKSVPPYSVVVGNPGRIIRMRLPEDSIEHLLKMQWWNWPYERIFEVLPLLQSTNYDDLYQYWKQHVK